MHQVYIHKCARTHRHTHSLCCLNLPVKPRCAEGNLSSPPITTICHYCRSMEMIDGEYLLCWQRHRDRSPGTTTDFVRGLDPAGKSPSVNSASVLSCVDISLDWWKKKLQTGFLKNANPFSSVFCCICFEHSHMSLLPCQKCYKFCLNNPFF